MLEVFHYQNKEKHLQCEIYSIVFDAAVLKAAGKAGMAVNHRAGVWFILSS